MCQLHYFYIRVYHNPLTKLFADAATIIVPPVMTVYQACSDPLSLNCSAEGLPLPRFTWIWTPNNGSKREFFLGFTDVDGRRFIVSSTPHATLNRVDSVFLITSMTDDETCMEYTVTCRADNYLGGQSELSYSELITTISSMSCNLRAILGNYHCIA